MSPAELGRQALGNRVHDADPADLTGMVQLAAAWFTDGPDRGPDGGAWRVRAAVRAPQVPHLGLASGWECLASDVVAFQHDGRWLLAQVSQDDDVRVWDPTTATLVRQYPSGSSDAELAATCFPGPDGRPLLATGGWDRVIHVSDPTTGTTVGSWPGHEGPIWKLETILDGPPRVVSWSEEDGTRRTWDAWSGKELAVVPFVREADDPFPWPVTATVGCPDGRQITVLGDDEGWLTVVCDGAETARIPVGPRDSVHGVAAWLDEAGRPHVAVATEYELRVVAPDARVREVTDRHTEHVVAVAGTRELLATASHDDTLRVWDVRTGRQVRDPVAVEVGFPGVLLAHGDRFDVAPPRDLSDHPFAEVMVETPEGDRVVATHRSGIVEVRDAATGRRCGEPVRIPDGDTVTAPWVVDFDGGAAVACPDGSVRFLDVMAGSWGRELLPARQRLLEGHEIDEPIEGLDARDGRLVAGWRDGTVAVRDADTTPRFLQLGTHLTTVAALPDGGVAVGLRDGWAIVDLT
ncbi:WD40 repeat domain-containing protein [Arachnia propionica]|uniref:WD40 repeat domain-containing protein n=1 Tax=Arachnia propionica TaxID=1750 RepID=A0A3P1WNF8_9ACTN|nr:WD40 repeat domain-containing protein [Arachnia propionica]RRD48169.1 WD40 repeat domain-containing protein [Arachnia propionica]